MDFTSCGHPVQFPSLLFNSHPAHFQHLQALLNPEGFPQHSHANKTIRLFKYVSLTYELENLVGKENSW